MSERTFCIQTFGCQMNVNDSLWLTRALERRGFTAADPAQARIHILNTCSVRDKPEQKVYSALGRVRKLVRGRTDAFAVVAGCVAQQIGAGFFERFAQVRLVVGGDGLAMAPGAIERLCEEPNLRLNLTDFSESYPERDPELDPLLPAAGALSGTILGAGTGARTNDVASVAPVAYVNIMQGCDNFCAYCIVPYTRGRQKSRSAQAVLDECRALLAHGARELVLLGQNVNAFGQDAQGDGTSFTRLLHQVAALPGLHQLRFVTPHPKDFAADTIAAFGALPVLSPRLHLPVQSGSDAVLTRMGRHYSRADYLRLVDALRKARPDMAFSADIIVGFPGESEQDFADTLSLMRVVPFVASFSFCYSDRPGAAACAMPDKVPADVAALRLERLQAVQSELGQAWLHSRVGVHTQVLLEGTSRKALNGADAADTELLSWQGRDPWGNPVNMELRGAQAGQLVPVRITAARKHSLMAESV